MANLCYNAVAFYGNGVEKIINSVKELEKEDINIGWFSGMIKKIAGNEIPCVENIRDYCGMSYYYEESGECPNIKFYFDTAWNPYGDEYKEIAEYFGCQMVYLAEECGCGIFVNTDEAHTFFDNMFRISSDDETVCEWYCNCTDSAAFDIGDDPEFIEAYYSSEEDLISDLQKIVKKDIPNDIEGLEKFLSDEGFDINIYDYR